MYNAAASTSSFGMKLNVTSLICVAAWKTPIKRPAASAASSIGAASIAVTTSAC